MLLFKKKFLEAIRAGEKTQTIRLWKYCRMRAGQRSYIPGAGYIRVTGIAEVRLDALTDEDARPDGFDSADLLREEINRLYPRQLAEGYKAFKISFQILPPEEQVKERGK
ncbi:MAG: ASCH domain-containing protein [Pirellulales bacterium]|nr:ASCH domain-containing protein [Pirellulales bacterium]